MRRRAAKLLVAGGVAIAAASLLGACSRDEDRPREVVLGPRATIVQGVGAQGLGPDAATTATTAVEQPFGDTPAAKGLQPFQLTVTRTVITEAGASKPTVSPDDAILERARVAAGGCFSSLSVRAGSPPQRSAHIVFSVIPSGTVSTADVSSADTTDDGVLDCVRQTALSTTFSDNGGGPLRTYAIDVRVIARGNTGGR